MPSIFPAIHSEFSQCVGTGSRKTNLFLLQSCADSLNPSQNVIVCPNHSKSSVLGNARNHAGSGRVNDNRFNGSISSKGFQCCIMGFIRTGTAFFSGIVIIFLQTIPDLVCFAVAPKPERGGVDRSIIARNIELFAFWCVCNHMPFFGEHWIDYTAGNRPFSQHKAVVKNAAVKPFVSLPNPFAQSRIVCHGEVQI